MLRTLTPPAVVAADHGRSDGSAHSHRACAADKPLGSAGGHGRSLCTIRSPRDFSAGATATESPSRSSSVSKLVGASDFIHIDDLEVRGSVPSNRKPSLALLLSSVACRDSPCASARCLQAAQVVGMSRELLQRGRAMAAAAAVGERLILSHVLGRWRDRHRPHGGLRAACMQHAAERQQRCRFGWQPSLLALGLGSSAQLSSWDSSEQQWRLQGALARVAALRP